MADRMAGKAGWGRWTWLVTLCLAGLLLAHAVAWWVVTGRIERGLPAMAQAAATAGWTVGYGGVERAGWPWSAQVVTTGVSATRGAGLRWTSERVVIAWSPRSTGVVVAIPEGRQTIQLGVAAPLVVRLASGEVRMPLNGGPTTFEARDLIVDDAAAGGGTAARSGLMVAHLTGSVTEQGAGVTADGVRAGPRLSPPFDGPLALTIGGQTTVALPQVLTPETAAAWRAAGGAIAVPAMELRWGPLHMTGSGRFGLDEQLQPEGRARVEVEGAADVLDAAGRGGMIAAGPAQAARAVVALLALGQGGTGRGIVPLPVVVEGGTVGVAGFPLLRLPAIDWNLP